MQYVSSIFLALQLASIALAFGMGGDAKALLLALSFFFMGAFAGSVFYSSINGKGGTHGIR